MRACECEDCDSSCEQYAEFGYTLCEDCQDDEHIQDR